MLTQKAIFVLPMRLILTTLGFILVVGRLFSQASFEEKVTSASNVAMTINNLGLIGNSFGGSFDVLGYPSCEFPANSGIEHIFEGGLWVGAKINGSKYVSTGAIDAPAGYSTGRSGFEFSAEVGANLEERSSLFNSPFFHPNSISHQDFRADFSDKNILIPGTNIQIQNHTNPLGLTVHFESYNWNFPFANFFVILNYRITNTGNDFLEEPMIGFWMDGVVRNVNITRPGGTAFYNKSGNGYLDTLYMAYEFDANGDVPFTNSYVGLKYLGAEDNYGFHHPALDTAFKDHYNTWLFQDQGNPLYFFPTTDNQRYDKMGFGLNRFAPPLQDWETQIRPTIKQPGNRSSLFAAGPFNTLAPGESIDVAFAIVCAKKADDGNLTSEDSYAQKDNLIKNAFWAQTAYNGEDVNFNGILDIDEDRDGNGRITRYILPSPPDIPIVRVVPKSNAIEVYWSDNAEKSIDPISKKLDFEGYRLYKTRLGFDVLESADVANSLRLVAQFDKPGNALFYDNGFSQVLLDTPRTFEGDTNTYRYKYVFDGIQNGWQHAIAVTGFDQGDEVNNLQSLESSTLANLKRVFPGTVGNTGYDNGDPFVYPNPYYAGASWEGSSSLEEDRKIVFANLPSRSKVRVYTVAGDLVDVIEHDESYAGEDIQWFSTYSDPENAQFSGGEHGWDLLSKDNQIIARGIYLFSVEDLDTGKIFKGKFVVIK